MYVQQDENGLARQRKLPPSYPASFTLLRDVALEESIYMTDAGSLAGLAVARLGRGCLVYIGDDSLMMKEETAHLIVILCGGKAPWLQGKGSGYAHEEMKEKRENLDLARAIYEHERQERMHTKIKDFDHLRPDVSWNPDDEDKIMKREMKEEAMENVVKKSEEEERIAAEDIHKEKDRSSIVRAIDEERQL